MHAHYTNHERSGPLGPWHHVVRDPQSEGLVVVLIRIFLPPDLKLPDGSPACGEAYVTHLGEQINHPRVIYLFRTVIDK